MDVVRIIAAALLCLTLVGMALTVWARRRGLSLPGRSARQLRVCESTALDPRTSAHVLAWGAQRWLVVSGNGALHLHELAPVVTEAANASR